MFGVVVAIAVPFGIAFRQCAEAAGEQHRHIAQAFMALVLKAHVVGGAASASQPTENWLRDLEKLETRITWAGIFQADGNGVELRRENAPPRDEILMQIKEPSENKLQPLLVNGRPSKRYYLINTAMSSEGQSYLAAIVDLSAAEAPSLGMMFPAAMASIAALVLLGLAAQSWIGNAAKSVAARITSVESDLKALDQAIGAPAELVELAESLQQAQRELLRYRAEATQLKYSLEHQVEQRTKAAERAAEQATREAGTDALTRLANRRQLELDLAQWFENDRAIQSELAALWIDVDNFKLLNDTAGHQAGDDLLGFLGELLRATTRQGVDQPYRYGGDEFVVLLKDSDIMHAERVAEQIAALFAQRARTLCQIDPPCALSIGIALRRHHITPTAEALLQLADQAMYFAKQANRRVASADDLRGVQPQRSQRAVARR
ncbi:MAG: GGDEF domain-containing protein [Phycisphaerae bacterium]|nr:GGDEF domain-containing protein [Phycisphaerae bacterium]